MMNDNALVYKKHGSLMPRLCRSLWRLTCLGPLLALAGGCVADSAQLDRALLADRNPAAHNNDFPARYLVRSPDVLDITIPGRPDWSGPHPVNPDGRVLLDDREFPRVEGRTVQEIEKLLADHSGVPAAQITVVVTAYNSQHLYILSEAPGVQRVVAYQGPETIVDLLQRVGGMTNAGAPRDVQVVRSHVADGTSPEVFHVDLEAILLKQDQRTNLTLESFDQIYIGETRGSCFLSCVPPVLRPLFRKWCGMGRT
jgi:protein involved in polysaccharide export with SLBB domain